MSSPSNLSENAAPDAPVSPASPNRAAGIGKIIAASAIATATPTPTPPPTPATTTPSTPEPIAPPPTLPTHPHPHPHPRPRPDAPLPPSSGVHDVPDVPVPPVAPAPAPAPAPAAGHQGPPTSTTNTTTTTTSSAPQVAPSSGDQIKYHRGPAVLTRPHGPSLLTQALATARGIHHPFTYPEPSAPSHTKPPAHSAVTSHPPPPQDQSAALPSSEPHHQEQFPDQVVDQHGSHDASSPPSDGDSLTPRGSPSRSTGAMPSATAVATAVAYQYGPAETSPSKPYNMLDLREANAMLNGHRDFFTKGSGRGTSLERTDRERRAQDRPGRFGPFTQISASGNALVTPPFTESPSALHGGNAETAFFPEAPTDPAARKAAHRVSMGPEKAWSISTGEEAGCEDGQVEKSIAEAITGAEPNARASRKASHSLRFFKEGNPDEKSKKKDSKLGQHAREKLPPTTEAPETERDSRTNEGPDTRLVLVAEDSTDKLSQARPIPTRTPETEDISASPEEYTLDKRAQIPTRDVKTKNLSPSSVQVDLNRESPDAKKAVSDVGETGQKLDAGVRVCEAAEDGEESGEEKISSAVFLPHQGPEQSEEETPLPGKPARSIPPSRTLSRTADDFHPWLVKAGEPEVNEKAERVDFERKVRPEPADVPFVASEVDSTQAHGSAITDDHDFAVRPSKPSRPISQYQEEHIHNHPLAPKQPLEAIELIPYKHQVGGHTTLWRFSRRAVCKQLNNRENEFYEKVEKYHRDLLAFLPRYIGVLNVTFQKKQRRKSTAKRDDAATAEIRSGQNGGDKLNGRAGEHEVQNSSDASTVHQRVISQSLQAPQNSVPTVTFVDNQHILPRSLLQPSPTPPSIAGRFRSSSASIRGPGLNGHVTPDTNGGSLPQRPSLQDHQANSWGATTVNKKLRNEVFNDAFLKRPIAVHRHRKGHQRAMPRRALQQVLRTSGSDPSLAISQEKEEDSVVTAAKERDIPGARLTQSKSDVGPAIAFSEDDESAPKDVTGTSAPEPEIIADSSPAQKKKRRYSGTGLRRKPKDVRDDRGDLKYFEEADDVAYKSNKGGDRPGEPLENELPERPKTPPAENGHYDFAEQETALSTVPSTAASELPSPTAEFKKIPRPVNPKEAQTQRDSRVEYFLLLEDLTAGMKRPCIMDLKMGTRQYGVDATPKKQKSQQGKCAKTTSRELGVRVCGLQVWDVKTQSYVFKDKYYGRDLKKGQEFQDALTRFLYDGVDRASILRHIPTVLQKLDQLEVIIARLDGYRFYAASLLMFYDGDVSADHNTAYDTAIEDSTTDFATDTEEAPRKTRRNPREIDFKMADFANCVTAEDVGKDRSCPPRHPDEPDRGFLRGLRSLRRYFLKIQRDTRADMGLIGARGVNGEWEWDREEVDDEGSVSE